jgi:peptidyl-prolyl cis-trans isomerase D
MLTTIREKFMGGIAIAILALIGVTFVFVGGANFAFIGSNYAAKVDGVDIGLGQFEQAYRDEIQANPTYAQLPDDLRTQLRRNVLEGLIQQRVIDNYLSEAGYQISDEQITRLIQQTPDFQTDGVFDIELYRSVLAQNGYEPTDFEWAQRVTLRRNQLSRAVQRSSLVTPAAYRRYLNLSGEQRVVALATLNPDLVADGVSVTDEMITAYYDNNPTLFQLPESADVKYVEIQRSEVARGVSVSEEDLLAYYEENKDIYTQDEQRRARHVLVLIGDDEDAALEKAEGLAARIRAGEPFEDIARANSEDPGTSAQGGDLGTRTRSQLPGELGATIFSMGAGEVAGPIRSDFGYHVVRLDEVLEQGPLPLDQVRAEMTSVLQDEKADQLFLDLQSRLSYEHFDATSIEDLAEKVGLEVKTETGYTRNGGTALGAETAIVDAVFDETTLSGEQLSQVIEIDAGRTAVFAVTQHNPATREPLDDVRERIESTLRLRQSEELMAARADEMIAALAAGTDFADAAEAIGAAAGDPVLMSRGAEDADQFVSVAVFTAVKPSEENPTTGSTRNGEGGYTVYSVEAVLAGRPELIPVEQRDSGKVQLTDQAGLTDFIAFVQALREDAEVIINEDAVASTEFL